MITAKTQRQVKYTSGSCLTYTKRNKSNMCKTKKKNNCTKKKYKYIFIIIKLNQTDKPKEQRESNL